MFAIAHAGRSDTGRQRPDNQDRWAADVNQHLFVVADGVARSAHGALAAQLVTEQLPACVAGQLGDRNAPGRLGRAVAELSDALYVRGQADPELTRATSTVVAVLVSGSRALIAHLGDSRAYRCRKQQLQHLTCDHTLLQELINVGQVAAGQTAAHPARNVLTRYVGMIPPALPGVTAIDVQPGDRLLLCSDGVHGVLDKALLCEILTAQPDPGCACDALVDAANAAGGPDNITAVVVDIAASGQMPADAADSIELPTVPW